MTKKAFACLLLLIAATPLFCLAATQPKTQVAYPPVPNIDKYGGSLGQISLREAAELGLTPEVLKEPTVVLNWHRKLHGDGRFVLETLPEGTLVLKSKDGRIVLKADCGNALVTLSELLRVACPPPAPATMKRKALPLFAPGPDGIGGTLSKKPSVWREFWDGILGTPAKIGKAMASILGAIGRGLLWLLALLFIIAIPLVLFLMGRAFWDARRRAPAPAPVVTPPAPGVVTPAPVPAPVPAAPAIVTPAPVAPAAPVVVPAPIVAPATPAPAPTPAAPTRFIYLTVDASGARTLRTSGFTDVRLEDPGDGSTILRF